MPPSRIAFLIFVAVAAVAIVLEWRARGSYTATLEEVGRAWQAAEEDAGGLLAIRVETDDSHAGLVEPVTVSCRPVEHELGSWTEANLDWYTGRAIYATTFNLTADYLLDGFRLRLDLGKVCWCAEVWLNGKLVGTRVWPPYEIDVSDYAQRGENRLDVVVANLLANRMRWDIFDDVKGVQLNRKWHDGNILRDRWCLQSGLIGPVRLVPLTQIDMVMSPTETVIEQ